MVGLTAWGIWASEPGSARTPSIAGAAHQGTVLPVPAHRTAAASRGLAAHGVQKGGAARSFTSFHPGLGASRDTHGHRSVGAGPSGAVEIRRAAMGERYRVLRD